MPEKKHAGNKKEGIDNTGDDDPPEKLMLLDEQAGFFPAPDRDDYFFEQSLNLVGKYSQ